MNIIEVSSQRSMRCSNGTR